MDEPNNQNQKKSLDEKVGEKLKKFRQWTKDNKTLTFIFSISTVIAIIIISTITEVNWIGFGNDLNKSTTVERELTTTGGKEKFKLEEGVPKEDEDIIVNKRVVKVTNNEQSFKTLWDWLQLGGILAIPLALYYFERSEQRRAEKRNQLEQKQAEKQAELERDEAAKIQREDALENYINQISQLLIDTRIIVKIQDYIRNNTRIEQDKIIKELNKEPEISVVLDIIRARTLSILRKLDGDGERKGEIIRFLIDIELIDKIDLNSANLKDAHLKDANLKGAHLSGATLKNAFLNDANLSGVNLESAFLNDANLSGVNLESANLKDANLKGANLKGANLKGVNLKGARLSGANLSGVNLESANLKGANLKGANLKGANLKGANLKGANLKGANLSGANSLLANLDNVKLTDLIWDKELYQFIDTPLQQILCHCLVYELPVPMEALEAACDKLPDYKQQLRKGVRSGVIDESSEDQEENRIFQVSRLLPHIIPNIKLSLAPEVYSLYQKAHQKLHKLWGNQENGSEEKWQEIFRLKFANKENPERFRQGFYQMLAVQYNPYADKAFVGELRKVADDLVEDGLCTQLEKYLRQQQWKEADEETAWIFYQVMVKENYRDWNDLLKNFPCETLRDINSLWLISSNNKFGISIKAEIYRDLGSPSYDDDKWNVFAKRVGWKQDSWLSYHELMEKFEKNNVQDKDVMLTSSPSALPVNVLPILIYTRMEDDGFGVVGGCVYVGWLGFVSAWGLSSRAETCGV